MVQRFIFVAQREKNQIHCNYAQCVLMYTVILSATRIHRRWDLTVNSKRKQKLLKTTVTSTAPA